MERKLPERGESYRHFLGKQYQILEIARHAETLEELIICKDVGNDGEVFAVPLPMFMAKVDKTKYPDSSQEYCFETEAKEQGKRNDFLICFLDADTDEERLNLIQKHQAELDEGMIVALSQSLDFVLRSKNLDMKILELQKYLKMRIKYERRR